MAGAEWKFVVNIVWRENAYIKRKFDEIFSHEKRKSISYLVDIDQSARQIWSIHFGSKIGGNDFSFCM